MNIWKSKLDNSEAFIEPKDFPNFLPGFIFRYLGPFTKVFALTTALDAIHAIIIFLSTLLLTDVLNILAENGPLSVFDGFLYKFILLYAVSLALSWIIRKWGYSLANVFSKYLTFKLYKTALKMDFAKLSGFSKEKLTAMFAFITKSVDGFIGDRWLWGLTHDFITVGLTLWIIGSRNLTILLFDIAFFSLFIFVGIALAKKSQYYSHKEYLSDVKACSVTTNFFINLNSVKRLFLQDYSAKIIKDSYLENYRDIHNKTAFHSSYWLLQDLIYGTAFLTTMGFFVSRAARGEIPVGYIVLLFSTILQIKDIFEVLVDDLLKYNDFAARMKELKVSLAGLPVINTGGTEKLNGFAKIEFKEVGFDMITPKNTRRSIFVDNLYVEATEKIGITGPSGCGKTTLLNMLMQQVTPNRGQILVDGVNIANFRLTETFCSVISQSDILFNISIKDNIVLGSDFDAKRYQRISEGVKAADFINQLPEGDASIIGNTDVLLSHGQEQRIKIARGLYRDAKLYLLDEPFSGLDWTVKKQVIAFVYEFLKEKSFIIVTHTKDELDNLDRVYAFDRSGKLNLAEVNPPAEADALGAEPGAAQLL
ncbi:TPA: hypothetical protein DCY43_03915 [candidate division WWE3 bacterium]|uniref:ABC transporter ATP-binding protein n=1 Tax=candidate division WWE3 bacterium TaxID=2053526 RepID=A0A351JU86_UNCKA|nr:hypothetical protein [candidate division WWE3 bacterium]